MKEIFKHIRKLLIGLLLILSAILLVILLLPISFLWKIFVSLYEENRKAREILNSTFIFLMALAISIDKFGNVLYGGLFNDLLLINQKYKFGNTHETISEVLGWAQHYNDLTKTGKVLVKILDKIDPNHCEKTRKHGILLASNKLKLLKK